MAYGPNSARMTQARNSITRWAVTAGLDSAADLAVDYLGARGGYLVVAVTGLPLSGDVEAIVSPQGLVRVFTYVAGELCEVHQLSASAAA